MLFRQPDLEKEFEDGTGLYHAGTWVCRTTATGIRINHKIPFWNVVKAFILYGWINLKKKLKFP